MLGSGRDILQSQIQLILNQQILNSYPPHWEIFVSIKILKVDLQPATHDVSNHNHE